MSWPNAETRCLHDELVQNPDDDIFDCAREWLDSEPDTSCQSQMHAAEQMAEQMQKDIYGMYANDDTFPARLMWLALQRVRWKFLANYFVACAIRPDLRIRRRLAWRIHVEADAPPVNVRCQWRNKVEA